MATHKSAEKAARQAIKHRERNTAVRSEFKTTIKQLRAALSTLGSKSANAEEARKLTPLLNKAQSLLMKAAKRNIIKKETASRQVSRLSIAVHKATQPAAAK